MSHPPAPIPRIARRLTRIILLTSTAALALAGLVLVTYDVRTFREMMRLQRSIQAEIIGANTTSALVFDDPRAAEGTLGALRAAPRIEVAALYSADGRQFASYIRETGLPGPTLPDVPTHQATWHRFDGLTHLHVVHRVTSDGSPDTSSSRRDGEPTGAMSSRVICRAARRGPSAKKILSPALSM